MKHHIIKSLAALALGAMLLTGCSTKHKAVVEEAYIFGSSDKCVGKMQ